MVNVIPVHFFILKILNFNDRLEMTNVKFENGLGSNFYESWKPK